MASTQEEVSCIRSILATLVVAVAFTATLPADASAGCQATCRERVARKHCDQAHPVWCIKRAAFTWRVSFPLLRLIAWCESRLDPEARNASGSDGLLQIIPGTWRSTRYWRRSSRSTKWNALAGGELLHKQGTHPWVASIACWG